MKTVLYFSARWCGPCKAFTPQFDRLAEKLSGHAAFSKRDVEEDLPEAERHGIRAVPAVVILGDDGSEVWRQVGAITTRAIEEAIRA